MEKIEFEEGQLVKPATVTIDGIEYEVKDAEYTGETPLSPFVLNKMQDNIEESAVVVSATEPATGEKVWFNPHNSKNELDISKAVFKIAISVANGMTGESEYYSSCEEYIEVKPNTSYTFSVNKSLYDIRLFEYDKDYNFIKVNRLESAESVNGTTSAETKYVRWSINYNNKELTLEILKTLRLQIEEGSVRTQYQEYSNPTIFIKDENNVYKEFENKDLIISSVEPINGEAVWLKKGINLHNSATDKNGVSLNTGTGLEQVQADRVSSDFIKVEPNTNYVVSQNASAMVLNIIEYAKDKSFIKYSAASSVKTTSQTCYIRFYSGNLTNVQFEQNTSITAYEEYIEPTIYVKNGNGIFEEFINKNNLDKLESNVTALQASNLSEGNSNSAQGTWIAISLNSNMNFISLVISGPNNYSDWRILPKSLLKKYSASSPLRITNGSTIIAQLAWDGSNLIEYIWTNGYTIKHFAY